MYEITFRKYMYIPTKTSRRIIKSFVFANHSVTDPSCTEMEMSTGFFVRGQVRDIRFT